MAVLYVMKLFEMVLEFIKFKIHIFIHHIKLNFQKGFMLGIITYSSRLFMLTFDLNDHILNMEIMNSKLKPFE